MKLIVSDTCTNCNAILSPTSSSCPSCGTPKRSQSSGGTSGGAFCGSCGSVLASKFSPCPKCGHVKTTFAPPPQYSNPGVNPQGGYPQGGLYKNEGTGLILSIILGIFGFCGVGQIYAGRVGRGIGIMIGVWILIVIGFVTMGVGLIVVLIVFIWQIFDTKTLCKTYNNFLASNGRPPW